MKVLIVTHYSERYYRRPEVIALESEGFEVALATTAGSLLQELFKKPDLIVFHSNNGHLIKELNCIDKRIPLIVVHSQGVNPPVLERNNLKRLYQGDVNVLTIVGEVKKALHKPPK